MSQAHVICCNDSVEHVVIGTEEQAREKMNGLMEADFERHGASYWAGSFEDEESGWKTYRNRMFWRVRTVPMSFYLQEGRT